MPLLPSRGRGELVRYGIGFLHRKLPPRRTRARSQLQEYSYARPDAVIFASISPELFFRLFKDRNGFRLERLLLLSHPFPGLELSSKQRLYRIADPDEMRSRVGLVTGSPVLLLLEAERHSVEEILATSPQQSDYATLWQPHLEKKGGLDKPSPHVVADRLRKLFHAIPERLMFGPVRKLAMLAAGLSAPYSLFAQQPEILPAH
jgi:hypothetical protein